MNYRPEISAFVSGALVMIFEILGARILWAYTGNSLFVWTNIIALILWALAVWYYLWWEIADNLKNNKNRFHLISLLFILSACCFLALPFVYNEVLDAITRTFSDVRISSFLGTLILFVPAWFLLWMIAPICTKIHLNNLEHSGRVVWKIWSIWTFGSIFGTIMAGFFLIPFFGINNLLLFLAASCVIMAVINSPKKYIIYNILIWIGIITTYSYFSLSTSDLQKNGFVTLESPYSHITIKDEMFWERETRKLYIDNINHSWMFLDGDDLYAQYTKAYHLFNSFVPDAKDVMMIGGAAYSFPKSFLKSYPEKNIDVVEIDPMMYELAQEYFFLEDSPRLTSIEQDARVYLNTTEKKYDAILWDAFGSFFSIPYQLTTLETVQKKHDILTENGVVILNIINAQDGDASRFLHAQYLTYKQIFPEVFLLPVRNSSSTLVQNIMLVAAKNPDTLSFSHPDEELQALLERKTYLDVHRGTKILTDNYAPVDYYISMLTQR